MGGLREKQKAARDRRILDAAIRDFRARGYRSARIEDVAAAAEVSVGTVYNYYGTKGDLLMAIVAMEVEEVLEAGDALIAAPPAGAEAALAALVFTYFDHSLHYLSKEMWRHAMALSVEAPDTPQGQRYAELDARLCAQVGRMIARLQGRGEVAAGLDSGTLGTILFNDLNQMFTGFTREEAMTLDTLKARQRAHLAALARLIAPRGAAA